MPSMNRRATRCITMATGRPTSSTFQPSRFRFVYLGPFRIALSKQSFPLRREISVSLLPSRLRTGFLARERVIRCRLAQGDERKINTFSNMCFVFLSLHSPAPKWQEPPFYTSCLASESLLELGGFVSRSFFNFFFKSEF